jgi:hypothetical protein
MVLHLDEEQVDHFSFFITCILNQLLIMMNTGVDDVEAILNQVQDGTGSTGHGQRTKS